jgi:hypothetical protein
MDPTLPDKITQLSMISNDYNTNDGKTDIDDFFELQAYYKFANEIYKSLNVSTRIIYRCIYTAPGLKSDFKIIINENINLKILKHSLFIYNENFSQFESKNNTSKGGGNGFLRKYRQDYDNFLSPNPNNDSDIECRVLSLGIPTGIGNDSDTDKFKKLIKESLINIKKYIDKHSNITRIYYSADQVDNIKLGLSIYAKEPWTIANISFIDDSIKSLFDYLESKYNIVYIVKR